MFIKVGKAVGNHEKAPDKGTQLQTRAMLNAVTRNSGVRGQSNTATPCKVNVDHLTTLLRQNTTHGNSSQTWGCRVGWKLLQLFVTFETSIVSVSQVAWYDGLLFGL